MNSVTFKMRKDTKNKKKRISFALVVCARLYLEDLVVGFVEVIKFSAVDTQRKVACRYVPAHLVPVHRGSLECGGHASSRVHGYARLAGLVVGYEG